MIANKNAMEKAGRKTGLFFLLKWWFIVIVTKHKPTADRVAFVVLVHAVQDLIHAIFSDLKPARAFEQIQVIKTDQFFTTPRAASISQICPT